MPYTHKSYCRFKRFSLDLLFLGGGHVLQPLQEEAEEGGGGGGETPDQGGGLAPLPQQAGGGGQLLLRVGQQRRAGHLHLQHLHCKDRTREDILLGFLIMYCVTCIALIINYSLII